MQWLAIVFVAIIGIVIRAAASKGREQAKKQAAERAAEEQARTPGSYTPAQMAVPQPRPYVSGPMAARPQHSHAPLVNGRPAALPQSAFAPSSAGRTVVPQPRPYTPPAPAFEGEGSSARRPGESLKPQTMSVTTTTAASVITPSVNTTRRHTVAPSSISGHAHQETSMSGFDEACEPDVMAESVPGGKTAAAVGLPAFAWRPGAVLNGLIYAEILSKPKALRG